MLIASIWNLMIAGLVIYGVSQLMDGVRCRSYTDAVLTALIYSVIYYVGGIVAVTIGFGPAVLLSMIPFVGKLATGLGFLLGALLLAPVSLYIADKMVDGFEIKDFGTTVLVALMIGLGNWGAAVLFH